MEEGKSDRGQGLAPLSVNLTSSYISQHGMAPTQKSYYSGSCERCLICCNATMVGALQRCICPVCIVQANWFQRRRQICAQSISWLELDLSRLDLSPLTNLKTGSVCTAHRASGMVPTNGGRELCSGGFNLQVLSWCWQSWYRWTKTKRKQLKLSAAILKTTIKPIAFCFLFWYFIGELLVNSRVR